jgi:hypothetical protein
MEIKSFISSGVGINVLTFFFVNKLEFVLVNFIGDRLKGLNKRKHSSLFVPG